MTNHVGYTPVPHGGKNSTLEVRIGSGRQLPRCASLIALSNNFTAELKLNAGLTQFSVYVRGAQ